MEKTLQRVSHTGELNSEMYLRLITKAIRPKTFYLMEESAGQIVGTRVSNYCTQLCYFAFK